MVPLCPKKKIWPGRDSRACCARLHAILAALGAIFQAFPALYPCETRLPRGEMQAVPCGARSNTRPLPASTSQSSAGIRCPEI